MRHLIIVAVAYLLGSIPSGYLIVRASQDADIRETGSGGTGATNVSRRAGKTAGVVTLVLDALKGAAAVLIAKVALGLPLLAEPSADVNLQAYWVAAAAAVAVILGHMFPVWLGFRGGKGVATGVGVFLVLAPAAVGVAGLIFLTLVLVTRYVSLGSITAAAAIPLVLLFQNWIQPYPEFTPLLTAAIVSGVFIIVAHRANIGRLVQGTESKFR